MRDLCIFRYVIVSFFGFEIISTRSYNDACVIEILLNHLVISNRKRDRANWCSKIMILKLSRFQCGAMRKFYQFIFLIAGYAGLKNMSDQERYVVYMSLQDELLAQTTWSALVILIACYG